MPDLAAPSVSTTAAAPTPIFSQTFAALAQALGSVIGTPVEDAHGVPDSCDLQQRTTTGIAYLRCDTNIAAFAADPEGLVHWAMTDQLVTWTGDTPDPPEDAVAVTQPANTQTVAQQQCLPLLPAGCPIQDGATVDGYIVASGQTDAYRFDVGPGPMHVTADLNLLPADYDLYLADGGGAILAASVQEGTTAEEVDSVLAPGTYYLFVHSDPGRAFDSLDPYALQVSIAPTDTFAGTP